MELTSVAAALVDVTHEFLGGAAVLRVLKSSRKRFYLGASQRKKIQKMMGFQKKKFGWGWVGGVSSIQVYFGFF